MRAITCFMSTGRLGSIGMMPSSSSASWRGGLKRRGGSAGMSRFQSMWARISRAMRIASRSSSAR